MKKVMLTTLVILLFGIAFGCSCTQTDNTNSDAKPQTENNNENAEAVTDYFPIQENIKLVYEGEGNEFAGFTLLNDYTTENQVQQRINNGGTEIVNVLALADGKLTRNFSQGETYYRMNFLDRSENTEILLMEPLENGTSWTLSDGRKRTITDVSAQVITPSGSYMAIEVTTVDPQKPAEKTADYYARSVGLVKSVYTYGPNPEEKITASLKKIEQNAVLTQSVRFFYPNPESDGLLYLEKTVSFQTNDITRKVLEEAYKTNSLSSVLSPGAQINSLYLNQDGMVYIDLNPAFLTEMNAGSGYEAMILQSIANTFGSYFGAGRVVLTVAGQPYESGHIAMEKGDVLEVNLENAFPIN